MKPGRELDALVALAVGWQYVQVSPNSDRFFCRSYGLQSGWWLRPGMDTEDGWACAKCSDVPHTYSTEIGAAWEVVEKMQADDWYWNIDYDCDGLVAGFGRDREADENCRWYYEAAKTEPHAICLAALKAVEL